MAQSTNNSGTQAGGKQVMRAVSEPTEEGQIDLDAQQCAEVALYMYHEWEKAMQPPLYVYKAFPEWLEQVIDLPKYSPENNNRPSDAQKVTNKGANND